MVLHVAKSSFSNEVEHISFPAEAEKVRYAVFGVEEFLSLIHISEPTRRP